MKNRTEQLRDAAEVALPAFGKDVWTTFGDLSLSKEQKEELTEKLNTLGPFRSEVEKWVKDIITFRAALIDMVREHLSKGENTKLNTQIDGIEMAIRVGDRVLMVHRPKLPENIAPAVKLTLHQMADHLAQGNN